MITGSGIVAPEGFRGLSKEMVYHFLQSDSEKNRARMVLFSEVKSQIRADLITISRIEFEAALESEDLIELADREIYPFWLEPIKGISISHLERRRVDAKETYVEKVDRRFLAISELVDQRKEVLAADNPNALIDAYAKRQRPVQNAARLKLWFYTYLVFGLDKWALLPPLHRVGSWDREAHQGGTKLGRPSRTGKKSGFPADKDMKQKILEGFIKYQAVEKTQSEIYAKVVTRVFGCITVGNNKSGVQFIHPEGKPYPTPTQFRYWVAKQTRPSDLALAQKGRSRARAESGSKGSFAEKLSNLNQRIEFDGYNVSEKISGLTEGSAVDAFCVVRAVCGLSGVVVGIGFSEGKENMAAYRMALFSMAVDKVRYCELFAIDIKPEEWPSEGLSDNIIFDRGPAAGYDGEVEINWLGAIEITPVHSGQSKASVESSHPRNKKNQDQPSHFHSDHDFVQMSKREIYQVLLDNKSSDASRRMTEEMFMVGFTVTPNNIWKYLDDRGRNSAMSMPFDEAVRKFLPQHPASIKNDAVYLYGRKYTSPALIETGVFDRVAQRGQIPLAAYVISMCVRHIWIEFEGVLFELDFVRSASILEGSSDISLRDLKLINEARLEALAYSREERPAVQQDIRDRFEKNTGKEWDSGQRKLGRAVKNASAQRDIADYNRFIGRKS